MIDVSLSEKIVERAHRAEVGGNVPMRRNAYLYLPWPFLEGGVDGKG
jgi:hypothetical protein